LKDPKVWLRAGSRYIVMNNPLKFDLMTNVQIKDSYAWLKTTGWALPSHMETFRPGMENPFFERIGKFRKEFYDIASDTHKISKKSAYAQKNWKDAKEHEDHVVSELFNEVGKHYSDASELSPQDIGILSRILMKPSPSTTGVTLGGKMSLPGFNMNRRLIMAVERYLHSRNNEPGIRGEYEAIFRTYGNEYRKSVDMIIDRAEEALYTSELYQAGDIYPTRDPLLDLAFGTYGFLHFPHILQRVRTSLHAKTARTFKTYDPYGNISSFRDFDNIKSFEPLAEYYAKEHHAKDAETVEKICK
jgi:hypothetical protein